MSHGFDRAFTASTSGDQRPLPAVMGIIGKSIVSVLFLFGVACAYGALTSAMDSGEGFAYNLGFGIGVAAIAIPCIALVMFCLAPICGVIAAIWAVKKK